MEEEEYKNLQNILTLPTEAANLLVSDEESSSTSSAEDDIGRTSRLMDLIDEAYTQTAT